MKLNLKELSLVDSGSYACQVSNQFGKINRTFDLKVQGNFSVYLIFLKLILK